MCKMRIVVGWNERDYPNNWFVCLKTTYMSHLSTSISVFSSQWWLRWWWRCERGFITSELIVWMMRVFFFLGYSILLFSENTSEGEVRFGLLWLLLLAQVVFGVTTQFPISAELYNFHVALRVAKHNTYTLNTYRSRRRMMKRIPPKSLYHFDTRAQRFAARN